MGKPVTANAIYPVGISYYLSLKMNSLWHRNTRGHFYTVLMYSLFSRICSWCANWEKYSILPCLAIYQSYSLFQRIISLCPSSGWVLTWHTLPVCVRACDAQRWVLLCPGAGIRPLQYIFYYFGSQGLPNEICMVSCKLVFFYFFLMLEFEHYIEFLCKVDYIIPKVIFWFS